LGIGAYTFVYLLVQKVFWRLLAEIQTATLDQTYLSPVPPCVHIALGRPVASIVETRVVVGVMYAVTRPLMVRLKLQWHLDALIALASLIVGGAGADRLSFLAVSGAAHGSE
jgi:ABC-type uncharacterized transport system permease subunit